MFCEELEKQRKEDLLKEIKNAVKHYWATDDKTIRQYYQGRIDGLSWEFTHGRYVQVCPYCGELMECDTVDVGIGCVQCGPYYCQACGASEIHSNDNLELDEDEKETGCYKSRISPLANTCNGVLVSHEVAHKLYPAGLLDNCKPGGLDKNKSNELDFDIDEELDFLDDLFD